MTRNLSDNKREEVLIAFHEAFERPTAQQIVEWTARYPEFADDIRAHAAVARDWEARKGVVVEELDDNMLARGHSRVLNALYNAEMADAEESVASSLSFDEMMAARGTDVPRLARELNIGRSVLADLFNGGMLPPVGNKLMSALMRVFNIAPDAFCAAVQRALDAPRLGHAKAKGTPSINPRPYNDVVSTGNMSAERVQYWLSED